MISQSSQDHLMVQKEILCKRKRFKPLNAYIDSLQIYPRIIVAYYNFPNIFGVITWCHYQEISNGALMCNTVSTDETHTVIIQFI